MYAVAPYNLELVEESICILIAKSALFFFIISALSSLEITSPVVTRVGHVRITFVSTYSSKYPFK